MQNKLENKTREIQYHSAEKLAALTGHTATCEVHMIKKARARTMESSVHVFYSQFVGLELIIVFVGASEGIIVVMRDCEHLGCKTENLW